MNAYKEKSSEESTVECFFVSLRCMTLCSYYSLGMSSPASPTEMKREIKQGLTPVETAVIVTASVLAASSLPCILFLFITRRRRPKTRRKGQISPDGEPEEDLPSEISQLSEIEADLNIIVNRAYCIPEETRTYRSPKEAWARARELTIPKHVPQGAWF